MSSPTDWLQFYQRNSSFDTTPNEDTEHHQPRVVHPSLQDSSISGVSSVADATVVTTTVTSSSNIFGSSMTSTGFHMNGAGSSNSISSGSSNSSSHLNPERRVSKPVRRRKASRGTPITLLNTDTHNFRAMVQQFTGVPNAPFSLASHSSTSGGNGATNLNFELARPRPFHHQDPATIFMMQQQQQQLLQQQQQLQRQQFMFSLNNNNINRTTSSGSTRDASHHDVHNQAELMMNNLRLPANNHMEENSNGAFLLQNNISPNVFHGSSSSS